ncbi:MAG: glycosyltransferase family 2 protein [Armatimonadetes bacterium]|nr:glycosyltransferase family 2 protein [Armatimonadota bacterium]
MELSVVIVNYKMAKVMERCLESLFDNVSDKLTYEVIVVDTPSDDGAKEMVETKFPQVRFIVEERRGLALARNQGIFASKGRYILHLDSDTVVLPGSFERLVQFMEEHPDCAGAAPKLVNPDHSLQYSCRRFYTLPAILWRRTPLGKWFPNAGPIRSHLMMDWDHNTVREVDWMLVAGFIMNRKALEQLGPFDGEYLAYFEDVDWCYRAWKAGWKIYYVPEAPIIHDWQRQSAKLNKMAMFHVKSALRFYRKFGLVRPITP